MQYIIYFDIAALFINTILILLSCCRKNHHSIMNLSFRLMLIAHLMATIFDIIAAKVMASPQDYSRTWNYLSNMLYFLFHNYCVFLYVMYGLSTDQERIGNKKIRIGLIISSFIILLLIATTPYTKAIFYYDANLNYYHGPLLYFLYAFALALVIFVLYLKISNKEEHSTFQIIANIVYSIALFSAFVYHIFINEEILIEMFAIDCGFLVMYVSQDNPDLFLYKTINVYNKRAFDEAIKSLTGNDKEFQVLFFTPKRVEKFKELFPGSKLFSFEKAVINQICQHNRKIKFYVISELCFAIITTNYKKEIRNVDGLLAEGVHVNDKAYNVEMTYAIMRYPEVATNYYDAVTVMDDLIYRVGTQVSNEPLEANPNILLTSKTKDIENTLIDAIKKDQIVIYYEPVYEKNKEYTYGAEAILKIKNKKGEILLDDDYFDVADKDGLIIDIDEIALRKIGAFIKKSYLENIGINSIVVNLSIAELMNISLVTKLEEIIKKYDLPCDKIFFKIIDLDLSINAEIIKSNMNKIYDLGFKFIVDKYGTNSVNLSTLIGLPVECIQFDNEMLSKAITCKESKTIFKELVKLAKKLNYKTAVSHIDSADEMILAESSGIDYLHGEMYGVPMNEQKFLTYYKDQFSTILSNIHRN